MQRRFEDGKREGDGGSEDGEAYKSDYRIGKRTLTRRRFVKTSATVGAAVAGIPFNLTDITDIALKDDGELLIYPVISEIEYKMAIKLYIERIVCVKPWGCNWNCKWCTMKIPPYGSMSPMMLSSDQITGLLSDLEADKSSTLIAISGGEPLLQKEKVLELIRTLKANDYVSMLFTNGSLIEDDFISKANEFGLNHINISFYALYDEWHNWYTGHSNQDMIKALKLVTEKFEVFTTVTIVLFSHIDLASFEDTCNFLQKLNQDFIIKIACPIHSAVEHDNCVKDIRLKAEEIAVQYFDKIIRNDYYSKKKILKRYQLEEDSSGLVKLAKIWECELTKEAMTFGWKEEMMYG